MRVPTITPACEVANLVSSMLHQTPAGLFSDFDGTLSPMASTPDGASIAPGVREVLRALASQIELVGIVTGRAVDDARARVDLPDLLYVGNHGLEWAERGKHIDHPAGVAAAESVTKALQRIFNELDGAITTAGLIFEDKRLSGSIHYRLCEDPVEMGLILGRITERIAESFGLHVASGKMVFELRPSASVSKGTALTEIVLQRGLRAAVFLGDDVTDVDGFRALREMREEHRLATLAVGVLTPDTAPSVIEESDVLLDGVDDVVHMLERLSQQLLDSGRTRADGA